MREAALKDIHISLFDMAGYVSRDGGRMSESLMKLE